MEARWITFGARLLRLYVSQPDASAYEQEIISRMASYIIKVYFKVCFTFTFNWKQGDYQSYCQSLNPVITWLQMNVILNVDYFRYFQNYKTPKYNNWWSSPFVWPDRLCPRSMHFCRTGPYQVDYPGERVYGKSWERDTFHGRYV